MKNNGIFKGLFALAALVSFSMPMALFAPAVRYGINPRTGNRELMRYNDEGNIVGNYVPVRRPMPDMIGRNRAGAEKYRTDDGTIIHSDGRVILPDGTVRNRNQNQE